MKAVVIEKPGPPDVLQLQERPLPVPKPGWVFIRVKAFGLNRSELFTRQGHSGKAVEFPRILGIEREAIPTTVRLTSYAGEAHDFLNTPLQSFIEELEAGRTHVKIGRTFRLEEIVEAHRVMEENRAQGKLVVVLG